MAEAALSAPVPRDIQYLIIGGGLAGLAAANYLTQNGHHNFLLLEARKRLGGRVMTLEMGGCPAELGASYVHGILGNPLYKLAIANGLVDVTQAPKPHKVAAVTEGGKRVPFAVLQEVYEAYYWFFKRCEEYFSCKYKPPEGVQSVGEHVELEIGLFLQRFPPDQKRVRRLIFDYLLKRECCITGCDQMSSVDLVGIGSYVELPGGNVTLPRGYSSILHPVVRAIPKESILMGHVVKSINWNEGDEKSSQSNTSAAVNVLCDNGAEFRAQHVICAVPLGVLKAQSDLFSPPLPNVKMEAMKKLNFGVVNKIFLEWDAPFLTPEISEVILLWETIDETRISLKDRWYRKLYSFCKVSEVLFVSWISGDEARFMESLNVKEIADTCLKILRKFLNDPSVPKPKSCIYTAWNTQAFSRGSYTSIGVGGQQMDIETLSSPLLAPGSEGKKPVVAFAGEHCHSTFYSTGHGAFLSGLTAAQQVSSYNDGSVGVSLSRQSNTDMKTASISDLSSLLGNLDVSGNPNSRGKRDDGGFPTPR